MCNSRIPLCVQLLWFSLALSGCFGDAHVEVSGWVTTPSGKPIGDATVTLNHVSDSTTKRNLMHRTKSSATGEFFNSLTFSPAAKDGLVLRVEKDGYLPFKKDVADDTYNLSVILTEKGQAQKAGQSAASTPPSAEHHE